MWQILRSLVITSIISSTVSAVVWTAGIEFWKPFVVMTVFQFVGFWLFNSYNQYNFKLKQTKLDNERIAEFSKQSLEAECAYCKTVNLVPVRFDVENDFSCINCNKPNAVYIGVTVTQKTTPMNVSPLLVNTVNTDEQRAIDQLRANDQI